MPPPPVRPILPCGMTWCPAALRLLWPLKSNPVADIGRLYGVTASVIWRRSQILQIEALRPHRRVHRYDRALFRRLWADRSVSLADIGQRFGMHPVNVGEHGKAMGLPPRVGGRKPRLVFGAEFDAMWTAGVLTREIARYHGCSQARVSREAARRGLPARVGARTGPRLTLARFLLGERARAEQAALRNAGMVDNVRAVARAA